MAGITAIKRKGFRGGGMDASTQSFDASANPGRSGGPIGRDDSARDGRQGFTDQQIANQNASTPSASTIAKEKAKYEKQFGGVSPTGSRPMGFFNRINKYNTDYQKKANIKLAQKRAFQKYQDIEQYADLMDDYGLTAEELAAEVAANPSYGYDFSNLGLGKKTLGSNIGTNLEKYRTNLYDVNSKLQGRFSILNPAFDKLRPDTQVTALNTLNKARNYNTLAMDPDISREKLEALANFGKTPDQINPPGGGGGGNNQQYIPFLPPEEIEDVAEEKTFDYRFGTGQNVGADVLRGYVANGGRIGKAFGGIMDSTTGRKAYGLGSVFKSVGKAVGSVAKAAGKVLSSDLGKAALTAGAFYYGGGGRMPFTDAFKADGFGGAKLFGKGSFFSKANPLLFSEGAFNPLKFAGLTTAIGAMAGPAKVDQMPGDDGARGGRLIDPITGEEGTPQSMRANIENAKIEADGDPVKLASLNQKYNNMLFSILPYENYGTYAQGGRIRAQEGGLMNLGGMEKDYRAEGGFVPIGKAEKADDVPARLSVNEFVFTADAVRNAGGGDIDKGAEVMENMMKNLENGGRVSEESQGNAGAQEMFSVSERIGEVI